MAELRQDMSPENSYEICYANFAVIDFNRSYQMLNKLFIWYDLLRSISEGDLHNS